LVFWNKNGVSFLKGQSCVSIIHISFVAQLLYRAVLFEVSLHNILKVMGACFLT